MNTSTSKPRCTVITLTADQVNELRKGWQKNNKNVQSLISYQYTEKHCYTIHGFYVNDQLFWTCVLKEITGKSGTKDQAIPQSEVKPVTEVKPAEVNTDKLKFKIGQTYNYVSIDGKNKSLTVVDRTDKTITFKNSLGEPITRNLLHIGVNYECFSPSGQTVGRRDICRSYEIKTAAVKSTVKPAVKPAEVNTNNKIIFEVGQTYCYGYACGDTVVTIEIVKRTEKNCDFPG